MTTKKIRRKLQRKHYALRVVGVVRVVLTTTTTAVSIPMGNHILENVFINKMLHIYF
jgi:hypothetical protein